MRSAIRQVIALAWPMVIGMMSYTIMDVTDTLLAGWIGKSELAAMGMATSVIFLINAFFIGFFESVKILVAQATGAEQEQLARFGGWQGVFLAIPFGLCITLLSGFDVQIFQLLGGPEHIQVMARGYFRARLIGTPFWYVTLALVSYYQGLGNTRLPMFLNLFICLVNVGLCFVLVYGLGPIPSYGVIGTSYATTISCMLGMLIILTLFVKNVGFYPKIIPDLMGKLITVGWPVGVRWFLDVSGWTILVAFLARMGENELAANQIASKVLFVSLLPGYAIAEAACILTGQSVGAGDFAGVRRYFLASLIVAGTVMGTLALLFVLFPSNIVMLFQTDAEVVAIGSVLIMLVAGFQITDAVALTASSALNGTGDTRFVMFTSVLTMWFVTLPIGYMLGIYCGYRAPGIWAALTFQSVILASVTAWRFRSGKWKNKVFIQKGSTN